MSFLHDKAFAFLCSQNMLLVFLMFMQKSIDGYVYTPFTNKLCLLLGVSNIIFQILERQYQAKQTYHTVEEISSSNMLKYHDCFHFSFQRNIIRGILYHEFQISYLLFKLKHLVIWFHVKLLK